MLKEARLEPEFAERLYYKVDVNRAQLRDYLTRRERWGLLLTSSRAVLAIKEACGGDDATSLNSL